MTFCLVRAEIVKMRTRPIPVYSALAVVGLAIFAPLVIVGLAVINPVEYASVCAYWLSFPNSLFGYGQVLGVGGGLITCLVAADTIGSEYSSDTWKLILPRMRGRWTIVLTKLGLTVSLSTFFVMGGAVLYCFAGYLCLSFRGEVATYAVGTAPQLTKLACQVVELEFYSILAFCVALVSRSTVVGLVAGLFVPLLLPTFTFGRISYVMPDVHFMNILDHLVAPSQLIYVDVLFGARVHPVISAVVLVGLASIAVAAAGWLFSWRDIVGR